MIITVKRIVLLVLIAGNVTHSEPHIHKEKVKTDPKPQYKIVGCGGKKKR